MDEVQEVGDELVSVGRDTKCAMHCVDKMMSRLHFTIKWDVLRGVMVVKDCSSTGTCLNGTPIPRGTCATLVHGAELTFPVAGHAQFVDENRKGWRCIV